MFMFIECYCFSVKMFGYQTRYNGIDDVVVFVRMRYSIMIFFIGDVYIH